MDVVAVVCEREGGADAVEVEAVDELAGVQRLGQLGQLVAELGAGGGGGGVGAGNAVDGGDVHRPPVIVVGDVAGGGHLRVVGAQGADRHLVFLRHQRQQAGDPLVEQAGLDVLQLEFVGEGEVAPV